MEMMLGGGHHVEAGLVGKYRELAELIEHLLVALVVAPDRTKSLAVFERAGDGGQDEKHELHGFLLSVLVAFFWRRPPSAVGAGRGPGQTQAPDVGSPHQPRAQRQRGNDRRTSCPAPCRAE